MRNLIGVLFMIAGFVAMIGLSLYLLIIGVIYLVQNGGDLTAGEIAWEVVKIVFRDILSVIVGLVLIGIGGAILKK